MPVPRIKCSGGRAGRSSTREGFVYSLAHEDDVKIARWKEKHDTIPEDTKDPNLIKARKRILKKMPTRRKTEQYWNEEQFQKARRSPAGKTRQPGPTALAAPGVHAGVVTRRGTASAGRQQTANA